MCILHVYLCGMGGSARDVPRPTYQRRNRAVGFRRPVYAYSALCGSGADTVDSNIAIVMKKTRGTRSGLVVLLLLLVVAISVTVWRNGMFRSGAAEGNVSEVPHVVRETVESCLDTAAAGCDTAHNKKTHGKKSKYVPERSPLDEEIRQN